MQLAMPTLNHRHQPSTTSSTSSTSSTASSARPALQHILTNSPSNAVHFSRSAAPTSRRVRSHWFSHFAVNWQRSSRTSKFILALTLTLVAMQVVATIAVLTVSWEMYCDKPLRIYLTVYIVRLAVSCPLSVYLHFAPHRRPSSAIEMAERGEIYIMTEQTHAQSSSSVRDIHPPTITSTEMVTATVVATPGCPTQSNLLTSDLVRRPYAGYQDTVLLSWIDRTKSALDFFGLMWFIIGNYMLFSSTTCSETAVPLYYLSLVFIIYGYILLAVPVLLCTSVIFCLPCVLVGMRLIHVQDGVAMGGASAEDIAKIPVFRFKSNAHTDTADTAVCRTTTLPALFSSPVSKATVKTDTSETFPLGAISTSPTIATTTLEPSHALQDNQALSSTNVTNLVFPLGIFDRMWTRLGFNDLPSEGAQTREMACDFIEIPNEQDQVCAICLSKYEDGDMLCKLWCNHHFHKTCVHQWLALNSRCPMCKRDSKSKDHPQS